MESGHSNQRPNQSVVAMGSGSRCLGTTANTNLPTTLAPCSTFSAGTSWCQIPAAVETSRQRRPCSRRRSPRQGSRERRRGMSAAKVLPNNLTLLMRLSAFPRPRQPHRTSNATRGGRPARTARVTLRALPLKRPPRPTRSDSSERSTLPVWENPRHAGARLDLDHPGTSRVCRLDCGVPVSPGSARQGHLGRCGSGSGYLPCGRCSTLARCHRSPPRTRAVEAARSGGTRIIRPATRLRRMCATPRARRTRSPCLGVKSPRPAASLGRGHSTCSGLVGAPRLVGDGRGLVHRG